MNFYLCLWLIEIYLTLWWWTLQICNVQCDAQNAKYWLLPVVNYGCSCSAFISGLLESSAEHTGHFILMQRLIIMGLNSCTFKFDMSLCRERGRNIWYRTNSPFTLWAKLDYLVLLMGEERRKRKKERRKPFIKCCMHWTQGHCVRVDVGFTILGHFQMEKDL